ncbi:uncharacterized protein r-cup [Drosophila kikkawai]|uniref:Uncharacterized protein r-cup n=1 Tax=Drosophila kikkawai TaxID=30033 RepID=A0A6P4IP94_DROKI|nr:uncharacterized protein LOC108080166 [Drosophila kikkawai]KAH8303207.1 hypothetical protein KR059_003531 [Drosophila kikkawai]
MRDTSLGTPKSANLKPWMHLELTAEGQRQINCSWGKYFARRRRDIDAMRNFNLCVTRRDAVVDQKALCLRSKFQRAVGLAQGALDDSKKATEAMTVWDATVTMEMADCLYDLNRFEDNKALLHENVRRNIGTSREPFARRLHAVNANLKDSTGDSLTKFYMEHSTAMPGFYEHKRDQLVKADKRPLWKIRQDNQECDVQSYIDRKEVLLSPLESERRFRKTKNFYQNYLGRNWTDFIFMKTLRDNPQLLLDHNFGSSKERRACLERSFQRIKSFARMLHARSPMYHEYFQRSPVMEARMREANLFRIQYQTRRNMHSILRTVRVLRKTNDISCLRKFIEDVMGNYVILKTDRLMPWKVEFMNEVYNHLALSLCDTYRIPKTPVTPHDKNAMCNLLNIPAAKPLEFTEVIFGDRSSYSNAGGDKPHTERTMADHQTSIEHLERRLLFARLPIERAYLLHEVADRHMQQNHFSQCLSSARRAIEEAKACNSLVWQFLSMMLMAKSHAVLHKFERQKEVLNFAYELATDLKSPRLCIFIELCRMLNRDYITLRKMTQLVTQKRLRSKISNRSSFLSNASPQYSLYEQEDRRNLLEKALSSHN